MHHLDLQPLELQAPPKSFSLELMSSSFNQINLSSRWFLPIGLLLGSFAIRFLYLWQLRDSPWLEFLVGDGEGYFEWGKRIASGDWLGNEVFYQAPLYPYFLGVLQSGLGPDLWGIRLAQMGLGSVAVVMLYQAGTHFFNPTVGKLAGVMAMLYPPAIYFDGLIQKAGLGFFVFAFALWRLSVAMQQRRILDWGILGVLLGFLALLRENTLLLIGVLMLWPLWKWRKESWSLRLLPVIGLLCGTCLILGSVALRNWVVGETLALTTSQFGPNFYIGNNPDADGLYNALIPGRGEYKYERSDATTLAEADLGRSLSPNEVSDYWFQKAAEYIRSDPLDWLGLLLYKGALLGNYYELPDTDEYYVYLEWVRWLEGLDAVWNFGTLMILATVGMWVSWFRYRDRCDILYALLLTLAGSTILFFIFGRYRFPLVPILLLFAAVGVQQVFLELRQKTYRSLRIPTLLSVAVGIFTFWPILPPNLLLGYQNLALAYQEQNRPEEALEAFSKALAEDPNNFTVYHNRGNLFSQMNRCDQAIQDFSRVLSRFPNVVETLLSRAYCLNRLKRYELALEDFTRVLQQKPTLPQVHYEIGRILLHLQQTDRALAAFSEAIRYDPRYVDAYLQRVQILHSRQNYQQVVSDLNAAIEIRPENGVLYRLRGIALFKLNQPLAAVNDLTQSIQIMPNVAETYKLRGLIYQNVDDEKSACADWKTVCDLGDCELIRSAQREGTCSF